MKHNDTKYDKINMSLANISKFIPNGKENAVSMRYLANILDVAERDIRQAILNARLQGEIICGTQFGYYTPADDSELTEYYYYARTRALTTLRSLKATRKRVVDIEASLSETENDYKEELE